MGKLEYMELGIAEGWRRNLVMDIMLRESGKELQQLLDLK